MGQAVNEVVCHWIGVTGSVLQGCYLFSSIDAIKNVAENDMPRIAPLDPPYAEDIQNDFNVVMPPGIEPLRLFRTVGRNARVLNRMMRGGLLDKGAISLRHRELMILRTCANCNCRYEWGVHASIFGGKARFTADQLQDCVQKNYNPTLWDEAERLILDLADGLHQHADCSEELWQALRLLFDEAQLLELLALAGAYHSVSFLANACRIGAEPFAYPYPAMR